MVKGLLAAFTSLFLVFPVHAAATFDAFLKSKAWMRYLTVLRDCQRSSKNAYLPIDLIRIDLLPEEEFVSQATDYVNRSRALDSAKFKSKIAAEVAALSCAANDTLAALVKKTEKSRGRSLKGSSVIVLKDIPTELRTAMSAIDGLFLSSDEVGKKVMKDLQGRPEMNLQSMTYDAAKMTIDFEGQSGAWGRLNLPPQTYYELQIKELPDGKLRFRGTYAGESSPVGSDLTIRRDYLAGQLFNRASSSSLPFGAYPQPKEVWSDDTGLSHFAGDGHNHAH